MKTLKKNKAAVELGRLGGLKGGKARAENLTKDRCSEIASKAAIVRWSKSKKISTRKKLKAIAECKDFINEEFVLKNLSALNLNSFELNKADLIVTSPPYNVGMDYGSNSDKLSYDEYLDFSRKWLSNAYAWSKETGRLCLNVPLDKNKYGKNSVGADITRIAKEVGWKYQTTIIWNEQNISRRTAWGSWLSASAPYIIAPVELIIVFYKEEWKKSHKGISDINKNEFIEWTNGVWSFNGENPKRVGHPAPFPKELPKRCIKLFSFINDVVLDPFAGSGTTLIEAINNKRVAYGLEIDKNYIEIIMRRIKKECGETIK